MKKVLSLVLVIAMVLSSMSFAFASNLTDIADNDYEKAIETLVGLGVITGYEDGTFRPEKTITRAEMAKLMVITLGYGDLVAGSKSNFADTQSHWADAYIALAAGKGIVVGDGNGNFRPDAVVSYNEAITMLVRGLGYTDDCNELKGMTWPTNFKVKAAELDITDDVAMSTNGADRGGVAQLIYNALDSTLVSVDSDGNVVFFKDADNANKLLLSRLGEKVTVEITPDSVDEDSDDYLGDIVDLTSYMYQTLTVYENDDEYVVFVKSSDSVVIEGTVDSVTTADNEFVVEDADEDDFTIDLADSVLNANKVNVFYNGAEFEATISDIKDTFESITVVGFEDEDDDNGKIDKADELIGLVVTDATDIVRVEKEYVAGKAKLDSLVLPVDSDDDVDLTKITVTGDAESLEDVQEDDIVVQYSAKDDEVTTLAVTRNTLEGKVTRVKDSNTFLIDGVSYDTADMYMGEALILGSDGIFYLDNNGEIADFDGDSEGPTDYAVVLGVENGNVDSKFTSVSIDNLPQIKLATQDDETVVYDLYVELESDGDVDGTFEFQKQSETKLTDYFTGTIADVADPAEELVVETGAKAIPVYSLVKYSLNEDGQIDELEVVMTTFAYSNTVDFEKSSNELSDDVIVFDATGDDYEVVSVDSLPTEPYAEVVRNSNGEIEVVVVKADEIDDAADVIFAYIYDADPAYDGNSDKVQLAGVYTDNADSSIYTTDDTTLGVSADFVEGVYAVKYDGEAIDVATSVTTAAGTIANGIVLNDTADTVNAKGNMIEINNEWYAMSENATIVTIIDGEADDLADLYDIEEDETNLVVYLNADGDIDLILIIE